MAVTDVSNGLRYILIAMALFVDTSAAQMTPKQIVSEPGLAIDPAVSADGRWLAYASDRGGSRFLNLWLRPLAGGEPRRLTNEASDHREPAFSPDGRTIAYRSEAKGGGLYLLSIDGGRSRLLLPGGHRPRFSPDGKRILYWTGTGLFTIDSSGGQPRAIHPEFRSARDGVWSPDGKNLIFAGCKDSSAQSCDWWISPVGGGEPVATGARQKVRGQSPDLWLSENAVVFADGGLWVLNVATDPWRVLDTPKRLTPAGYNARSPVAGPGGMILFASLTTNIDVWSLPLDADRATTKGELKRMTTDPSIDQRPSLSLDGKKIAWETSRGGNFEVWVKDLVSGREQGLTSGPLREHMPALSRDGSKVVYDAHDGEKVTVFESAFQGGEPVKVWEEHVGQGSFQWTSKGDAVLYFHREPPGSVGLLNLSSKQRTVLLRHPKLNLSLADARLSPDARWIAFPVPWSSQRSRLAIARLTGKVIDNEQAWSYLTPETFNASQPEWSPNGRWLYFLSEQTGQLAVWAIPLSADKQAEGEPKLILVFPRMRLSIAEMRPRDIGLSVAKDKLALGAAESTGTLWSVQR
jgi:Tol biopolymer transport system component